MSFDISLSSVGYGEVLSQAYSSDGKNMSPEIHWQDPPASVKSYILLMEDTDARHGSLIHWVLYNINADAKQIPEDMPNVENTPEGWTNGLNSFGRLGYSGPSHKGKKVHRYTFTLYALNIDPDLPSGLKKKDLVRLISDNTVKQASVMVKYK